MSPSTKRRRLIAALNELVASQQDGAPSMEDVAQKAGLPLSIALQDVGDIETLLRLTAQAHLQAIHSEIEEVLQRQPPQTWDAVVQTILGQSMHYSLANPSAVPLLLSPMGGPGVMDEIILVEDEVAARMADLLPSALWSPIAQHDRGLNPFRLVIDMLITVLQHGYREKGVLEFDMVVEAKRVALGYLNAIEAEVATTP